MCMACLSASGQCQPQVLHSYRTQTSVTMTGYFVGMHSGHGRLFCRNALSECVPLCAHNMHAGAFREVCTSLSIQGYLIEFQLRLDNMLFITLYYVQGLSSILRFPALHHGVVFN